MSTNKYFNLFTPKSEQNLIDSLNKEAIAIHGLDCIYLPRQNRKVDLVLGEDVLAKFDDVYHIEVYIKTVDGFEGQGTLFSKFGVDFKDQITFSMSRSRWDEVAGTEMERPLEGDLIYFPLNNALFEIRFVEHESVFYNLGERYVYDLRCEQFAYSGEDIHTGIRDVDEIGDLNASRFYLDIGAGTGTYEEQELVYQGPSLLEATAKATLLQFMDPPNKLQIRDVWGVFNPSNGPVIGAKSGASYTLTFANPQDILDPLAENTPIENEADDIIDFSEHNPFSEDDY